ncbi:hypothetical protein MKK68_21090 [Methylobacterium sp. E-016]|uniref:hypothetical protein n=1 Tax=Methylobacterium sp. E-016 TaxID=2836556 RepID=UPI001FBACF54|nr:hypothetical protein [Methylobacterium sp. E-016]MCJ2078109.1 hypothetical protein [Methylobacterium sp. E-016]
MAYNVGDVVQVASGERFQLVDPAPAKSTPGAPILDATGSPVLKNGQLEFPWGQITVSAIEAFNFSVSGKPPVSTVILRRMCSRVGYIGANQIGSTAFDGSTAKVVTAPAAAVTLSLALNGTVIGTVAFAVGSKTATFTTTGRNTVFTTPGDVLTLTTSGTQDTALADLVGFISVH